MNNIKLDELRKEIDLIDSELINILQKRASIAAKIFNEKSAKDKELPFTPQREAEIFSKLEELEKQPLSNKHFTNIFKEIISASRSIGHTKGIAVLSEKTAALAALKRFGNSAYFFAAADLKHAQQLLEQQKCSSIFVKFDIGSCPEKLIEQIVNSELQIIEKVEFAPHFKNSETDSTKDSILKLFNKTAPGEFKHLSLTNECYLSIAQPGNYSDKAANKAVLIEFEKENYNKLLLTIRKLEANLLDIKIFVKNKNWFYLEFLNKAEPALISKIKSLTNNLIELKPFPTIKLNL
jgi:chorismate mutase